MKIKFKLRAHHHWKELQLVHRQQRKKKPPYTRIEEINTKIYIKITRDLNYESDSC